VRTSGHKRKNNPQGGRYATLLILAVIILAIAGNLLFKPRTKVMKQPLLSPPVAQKFPLPDEKAYPVMLPPSSARLQAVHLPGAGRMAIIIDDMGASMQEARSLAAIGVPVTFSIIPGLHSYRDVAAFAASNGIETMIHIPMQSKGWPQRRLESNGLLISMDNAAIAEHLEEFVRAIPNAVGANNHMGSEFTEHEEQMRVVLQALKDKGLFFVDSVTSPQTVGQRLAREIGMKSGRRNVFLDNEQDRTYIQGQLSQAVRVARKTGLSIVICHPHPETIKTLAALLPGLEKQGITLVSASRLVK
jgi:polysaccharide deacetylase 2 family uncharacterized protein YibQ